jgi:hypothetical protein
MELRSRLKKEGDKMSITLTGAGGFKAYFKGNNTVELLKYVREMLNIMNIPMANFTFSEEEEEVDRSDG